MRTLIIALLIAPVLLALNGCVWTPVSLGSDKYTAGKPIDETAVAKIEKGRTTSQQILQIFGSPSTVTAAGDNELYVYRYCETGGTSVDFLGIYDTGSSKEKCDELTVIVKKTTGIVEDFRLVRNTDK